MTKPGPKPRPPEERFWPKVDKSGDCWLWTGGTVQGYGSFGIPPDRKVRAHRFAYELLVGPIPPGMGLDHRPTCPKNCVNPEHLRPANQKQNMENLTGAQKNNLSSGIRGVTWDKTRGRWRAQLQHHGKMVYAGYFDTVEEAQAAAVAKRLELFTHNDVDRIFS